MNRGIHVGGIGLRDAGGNLFGIGVDHFDATACWRYPATADEQGFR
jgi:hypothetical protein